MERESKLSSNQITALTVNVLMGVGILSLPSRLAKIQENDGWLAIIITGGLTILPLLVINKIFTLYSGKNFFEITEEALGRLGSKLVTIIYLLNFIILNSLVTRHLAEMVRAFLLETTPIEVIVVTFMLTAAYFAKSGLDVIGRFSYHIYPMIIATIAISVMVSLPQLDVTNVLPVFQSDLTQLPKSIGVAFLSFAGYEVLLFAIPFVEDREKHKIIKSSIKGIGIVTIIYTLIFLTTLCQYTYKGLQDQVFPTLGFTKEINLPGFFIENLDGVVVAIWIVIIFGTMGTDYFITGKLASNLFSTENHDLYIMPIFPIVYILSLSAPNIVLLDEGLGRISNYTAVVGTVILPLIIYGIGYFKTRRGKV